MKKDLTKDLLKETAKGFCEEESTFDNKDLYGVTDGKAVGTYIENKFQEYLSISFSYARGNAAKGIDLPSEVINTDIKVTSRKQPQSSCPFKDAKQKIFGLGYNLLVFVYDKTDNHDARTAILDFVSCAFLEKERTADYTTTFRLREMVDDGTNKEDIIAYLNDRNIPAEDITLDLIAEKVLSDKPTQGYLTISNALQWRLQYARVVSLTDSIVGISKLVDKVNR
jgi:hypothetical protein